MTTPRATTNPIHFLLLMLAAVATGCDPLAPVAGAYAQLAPEWVSAAEVAKRSLAYRCETWSCEGWTRNHF